MWSTHPSEKRSERGSTPAGGLPGDMKRSVPFIIPCSVFGSGPSRTRSRSRRASRRRPTRRGCWRDSRRGGRSEERAGHVLARRMRRGERVTYLHREVERDPAGSRPARDAAWSERRAHPPARKHLNKTFDHAVVDDADDVRVVEVARDPRLVQETCERTPDPAALESMRFTATRRTKPDAPRISASSTSAMPPAPRRPRKRYRSASATPECYQVARWESGTPPSVSARWSPARRRRDRHPWPWSREGSRGGGARSRAPEGRDVGVDLRFVEPPVGAAAPATSHRAAREVACRCPRRLHERGARAHPSVRAEKLEPPELLWQALERCGSDGVAHPQNWKVGPLDRATGRVAVAAAVSSPPWSWSCRPTSMRIPVEAHRILTSALVEAEARPACSVKIDATGAAGARVAIDGDAPCAIPRARWTFGAASTSSRSRRTASRPSRRRFVSRAVRPR